MMKRVKVNDPYALFKMGAKCEREGDYERAVKYYTKAAELGIMNAHYNLAAAYLEGKGVEKDEKKKVYHLEEAAIGGHPQARYNLACYAGQSGKHDKAMKHFIISAKLGYDDALDKVKDGFALGFVRKEDYAAALRGHQAAVDATKSRQREEAYEFYARTAKRN
jgi:TPR repeat protein